MTERYRTKEEIQREAAELLAKQPSNAELKPKQRLAIPPQEMPAQDPSVRKNNMEEVATGYTPEQARLEAMRCLQCKTAPCIKGCPVAINIPAFIGAMADGDNKKAIGIIKDASLLPSVCGRVCPQESQCQEYCTVGLSLKSVNKAVAIGRLERFAADHETSTEMPSIAKTTGKKVAVVGSGPASITTATDLCRAGHKVTMYEAFHKPGGVLLYGIPEFRLPKAIVAKEIENLKKMGVEMVTNFVIGRTRKLTDLMTEDGFDAIFIGSGAGLPRFMNIEGENLVGVFAANEYLTRSNMMRAYDREHAATPIIDSQRVAVLGGGNVAMDAARTALRLGAEEVHLIYRRTAKEMPARAEEVEHAKEEGIQFHFLENAKRLLADEEGRVNAIECLKYELGEPDESGRCRPVVIGGSEFTFPVDTVIVAVGNGSNPLIKNSTPELDVDQKGRIIVDEHSQTSISGIFAGGDIVLGAATVILAMGEGRRAAEAINRQLQD